MLHILNKHKITNTANFSSLYIRSSALKGVMTNKSISECSTDKLFYWEPYSSTLTQFYF